MTLKRGWNWNDGAEGSAVQIWYVPVDSAEPAQRLTTEEYDGTWNAQPDWSPDGSKIVFASKRWGHTQLWFMNPDGGKKESFLWFEENFSPSWGGEPPARQLVVQTVDKAFVPPQETEAQ